MALYDNGYSHSNTSYVDCVGQRGYHEDGYGYQHHHYDVHRVGNVNYYGYRNYNDDGDYNLDQFPTTRTTIASARER